MVALPGAANKPIEELQLRDEVIGIDCSGKEAVQVVTNLSVHQSECVTISFEGFQVVCTHSHVLISEGLCEVFAARVRPGTKVLRQDGSLAEVVSVVPAGLKTVFAIEVTPHHTYAAAGLIHHNKVDCATVLFPYD